MKKSLWKNSLWIFLVVMTAILIPSTISLHAQTEDRSVVIAVGIDKLAEKQFELSAEIIVPRYETTYNQDAQVISAVGRNTSEAFANLSLQVGRIIGLSHCSAVIIGDSMKDENIIPLVDELLRSKRANFNAQLIYTTDKARDVLQKAVEIDTSFNQSLNEIVQFNDKLVNAKNVLLSDFYKTYYQGYGANFVPVISLSENEYEGVSAGDSQQGGGGGESSSQGLGDSKSEESQSDQSSSGSQSGSSGSSTEGGQSKGSEKKYLSNNGKTAIYQKGKLIRILEPNEVMGFGLLTNESNRGALVVSDVNDELLHDAELTFSIRNRMATRTLKFSKNGTPRLYYSFVIACRLEQISDNELVSWKVVNDTHEFLTPTVAHKLEDMLKSHCTEAINLSKEMKLDLFDVYKDFDRFEHAKWQKYLQSLDEPASYIENVEFFVDFVINDVD